MSSFPTDRAAGIGVGVVLVVAPVLPVLVIRDAEIYVGPLGLAAGLAALLLAANLKRHSRFG